MTGLEVARHFNARKTGRNAWVALCPAHPDSKPSMSIKEGKKGVMLTCWSQRCDVRDICREAGLTVEQLFYDSGRKLDTKTRSAMERQRKLEAKYEEIESDNRRKHRLNSLFLRGYSAEEAATDLELACELAYVLANWDDIPEEHKGWDSKPALEGIFRMSMENFIAYAEGVL